MAQKSWGPLITKPVNASKQPKGTIFGAYAPMKKQPVKKMSPMKKMAVKKKKVNNAAEKVMFGK